MYVNNNYASSNQWLHCKKVVRREGKFAQRDNQTLLYCNVKNSVNLSNTIIETDILYNNSILSDRSCTCVYPLACQLPKQEIDKRTKDIELYER